MRERHRDDRSVRWLENAAADARYGLAGLVRRPAFALVAVSVLALGIGATTAMFSLVDAVLLKPLPFPEPERIVRIWETPTPTTSNSTTTRTFVELQRQSQAFEALSAESASTATVVVNGEPIRLTGRYVSADHFAVFGVQPMIGRGFRRDEDQAGAAKVVLLSHAAWQQHFGGDPGILGRDLRLDNEPHQVIGVLPPGVFDRQRGRPLEEPASFWRLNGFDEGELAASMHWLNPIGRLKPGVTLAQAQQDVLAVRARIADTIPAWKRDWTMTVEPFDRLLVGDRLRQSIYVTLGAVVLLLLIACANITSLLLAQGVSRRHEIAVRAALGAGRGRIAAQLLVETLVLGLLGGVAGVGLAALLVKVGVPLLPPIPFTAETTLDLRVLAFAALTALTVSALVGVLPALRGTAGSAAAALNTASRGVAGGHDRTRRTIVAAEVAVSVVLICGAFLLTKSLLRLQQVDVGARLDHVITMSLDLSHDRYPDGTALAAFYPARGRAGAGDSRRRLGGDLGRRAARGHRRREPADARQRGAPARPLQARRCRLLRHAGHPGGRRARVLTRRPGRHAVRRRGQRGAGPPARRPLRPGRSRRPGRRSAGPRLRPRSPRVDDHRRHRRQRARPGRPPGAGRRRGLRADRAGAADVGEAGGADAR